MKVTESAKSVLTPSVYVRTTQTYTGEEGIYSHGLVKKSARSSRSSLSKAQGHMSSVSFGGAMEIDMDAYPHNMRFSQSSIAGSSGILKGQTETMRLRPTLDAHHEEEEEDVEVDLELELTQARRVDGIRSPVVSKPKAFHTQPVSLTLEKLPSAVV